MAKVLVVDDEPVVRELLRRSLEADGHAVIEGKDGAEGLEKFEDEKPDIVLLDIKMPRMDGIEALLRIRLLDDTAKVAMLTAVEDPALKQIALERGAIDFVVKQAGIDVFLESVAKIAKEVTGG